MYHHKITHFIFNIGLRARACVCKRVSEKPDCCLDVALQHL